MDIRQLKYFIAIAEEGQITSAAKRLKMAQPPLSQQLKLLEDELGTPLFERGPRSVQLTDAGRLLLNRARQITELAQATAKEIADFSRGLNGTLSIGTVSSSGAVLLDANIAAFHQKYSGIAFEIHEGNTFQLIDLLHRGIIEVGIVRTPFKTTDLECKYAQMEPMIAAMTPEFSRLPSGTPLPIAALEGRPLILYRRFEQLIRETCQEHGFEPTVVCKNDDARTTILWANAGLGVAIVPRSAFGLAANRNLLYHEIESELLRTRVAAIWVKGRHLSSLAVKFIESFGETGAEPALV